MDRDATQLLAYGAFCLLLGYWYGLTTAHRGQERADLQRRVWNLEAEERRRAYDQAVKDGKVPPAPVPGGPIPGVGL